jgi:hypothetical protein
MCVKSRPKYYLSEKIKLFRTKNLFFLDVQLSRNPLVTCLSVFEMGREGDDNYFAIVISTGLNQEAGMLWV